jgi:hypothetical protein
MFQALGDRLHHAVNIVKHVVVPKSQDGETLRPKPGIPLIVTLRLCSVLSTINLDNQSVPQTDKIDDILSQRLLAPKFVAIKLP